MHDFNTHQMYLNRKMSETMFAWYDYLLLAVMVGGSVGIGIYFGFFGKKQDSKKEYLLGGKSMSVVPVAISLIASMISGITTLSYPADVYKYGSTIVLLCATIPIGCILQAYLFLPIFFNLQLTSMYEYLQLRFNSQCRIFSSFMFSFTSIFYNAVVIYIPSIAFSQVTNINIHYVAIFLCAFCIFYTTIGGLKTVIWSDAFQFIGMIISSVAVVVVGFQDAGGVEKVWNASLSTGRLDIFDFRFDLTQRSNFWAISFAATIHWTSFIIVNQGFVQKCFALPTLSKAQKAVFIYGFGVIFFLLCMVLTGNIMYSKYQDCDPLSAHLVSRHDQLLPYFITDISEHLPGLVGIFMSGCFCAALSTFSSVLNTLASTIYEDFLSKCLSTEIKEKREGVILKLIVLITGVLSTALILVIEQFTEILPVIVALQGITLGPNLGLYIMGALIPLVTPNAAFVSAIVSFAFAIWIAVGNLVSSMNGSLKDYSKPLSVEGCTVFINYTKTNNTVEEPFIMYQLSFWYNLVMSAVVTVVVGVVLSFFLKQKEKSLDKNLFSPVIHTFLD